MDPETKPSWGILKASSYPSGQPTTPDVGGMHATVVVDVVVVVIVVVVVAVVVVVVVDVVVVVVLQNKRHAEYALK